jgi:hypothetical protein
MDAELEFGGGVPDTVGQVLVEDSQVSVVDPA